MRTIWCKNTPTLQIEAHENVWYVWQKVCSTKLQEPRLACCAKAPTKTVCSGKSYVLIIFASWEMFLPTVSIQPRRGWPQKDKAIKWNANVVLGFMNDLNFGYFLSDGRHYIGAKNVRYNRKKHNYYFLQFFLNVFHQIYFHILQFRQKGLCKFFMFTK